MYCRTLSDINFEKLLSTIEVTKQAKQHYTYNIKWVSFSTPSKNFKR